MWYVVSDRKGASKVQSYTDLYEFSEHNKDIFSKIDMLNKESNKLSTEMDKLKKQLQKLNLKKIEKEAK